MSRLKRFACAIALFCTVLMGAHQQQAWARQGEDLQTLLDERTATVWLEGQKLGELILGARAEIHFIYVDSKLSQAVTKDPFAPDWLRWNVQYMGTDSVRGKALFILHFKTMKPWTFDPSMIRVGNYTISRNDILNDKDFTPVGDLPSGFEGTLAFVVPKDNAEPGKEITLTCASETVSFKVPRR